MRIKSHIVKAVEEADYKVQYDTEVKRNRTGVKSFGKIFE